MLAKPRSTLIRQRSNSVRWPTLTDFEKAELWQLSQANAKEKNSYDLSNDG